MKVVFSFLLTCCLLSATAQQPDLVFHHLTQKDGLSYNFINCFLKDSRGILWIGTYNGLNRYDGAHFYIFRKGKDENSIPNNTVHKLAEDKKGNIWGATENGIFCYNQQLNSFRNYHTPGETDWRGIASIICDREGTVWSANQKMLLKFNEKTNSFERAPIDNGDTALKKNFIVRKNGMVESPDGKGLWLATRQGLLYYDKALKKLISNKNANDRVLFTATSSDAICATSFGHYWYYDNVKSRLVGFDPLAKNVKYILQPKELKKGKSMATVFEDNNHLLWVSTWQYDVYTIDYLHGGKVTSIKHDKNNLTSIAGDFFWSAIQESDGTMWLGTVGGVSRCNTRQSFYKVHSFGGNLFPKPNPAIEFVSEDRNDSTWWLTTNKGLLLHYNTLSSTISSYYFKAMPVNKNRLTPNNVNRMLFFKNRVLMFGNNGAWIKEGTAAFKPFVLPTVADSIVFKDGAVMNDSIMYCGDHKRLWRWNINNNHVEEIYFEKKPTIEGGQEPYIIYLTATATGKLWTINGTSWLSYVEGNKLVSQKLLQQGADERSVFFTSMVADKNGNLWLTRKGEGLLFYNATERSCRQYKQYDGLVMEHVMAAAADSSNRIWAAANNQFSVFNPLLSSFYNFTLPLSENNYAYINYTTTLANGHVICNVANEIVEFFPDRLKTYSISTQPLISTMTVGGIEKLLPKSNAISLAANENSFLLKFGLLTDNEASAYEMEYLMEGAEKKWTVAGNNFEASYNSLAPGNYIFKVKALANDKSWQTKETVLRIHIATPFYKSWWFISIMLALLLGMFYYFYRFRLHKQKQILNLETKAESLEKEKAMIQYESLKQHLNPHFLFNSLTSLRSLIKTDSKTAAWFLDGMSKVYRYVLKSAEQELVLLNEEATFVQTFAELQQVRFGEGLQVNINFDEASLGKYVAPVVLQNLVENAIKHNTTSVESPLIVDIFSDNDVLIVRNNLQRYRIVETSNKSGLASLKKLYAFYTDKAIEIEETSNYFIVRIPLL